MHLLRVIGHVYIGLEADEEGQIHCVAQMKWILRNIMLYSTISAK